MKKMKLDLKILYDIESALTHSETWGNTNCIIEQFFDTPSMNKNSNIIENVATNEKSLHLKKIECMQLAKSNEISVRQNLSRGEK